MSRKPQWTTSWSSTMSTRSRRSEVPPVSRAGLTSTSDTINRYRQSHPPRPLLGLAELDDAVRLQRLERGQPQAHPRAPRALAHTVVGDLEDQRPVDLAQRDVDARGLRVLVRV